jgi:hypothetical protein
MMRKFLFAGAFACALAAHAAAQPQPSPPTNPECPPGTSAPKPGEPLGERLGQSKGVICPPDVDPGIKVPTPESGSKMPVIPPPATEGGKKAEPK